MPTRETTGGRRDSVVGKLLLGAALGLWLTSVLAAADPLPVFLRDRGEGIPTS